MKKRLLVVGLLLSTSLSVWSQTTDVGDPVSWNGKVHPHIEVAQMPSFNVQEQLSYDSINRINNKNLANRFGFEHIVNYDVSSSGTWIDLPNGSHIWRLGVNSQNALSLNLIFDDFYLPEGATMHWYAADHSHVVGAYTSRNNNEQRMLGTELVQSSEAILEVFVPAGKKDELSFNINTIVHGYKAISIIADNIAKALNTSGNCNKDVDCPVGVVIPKDPSRNSVGMIVSGGGICTGSLIKSNEATLKPYFITANHCNPNNAGSWVYRFRWESPNPICAAATNSTNGPETMNVNGGTLRASHSNSDFALIELNSLPDPTWDIFYNGWDVSDDPANVNFTYGIHHPDGDIKKICVDNATPTLQSINFNGDPNTRVWRIADWDEGVTEPGSSGSPLFRPDGKIIGVLSGGYAACTGTNDNNQEDWYGRLAIAWDEEAANDEQLKFWLDPSNSGVTEIDGYDPNAPTVANDAQIQSVTDPSGVVCGTTVTPVVSLKNVGSTDLTSVTITYDIDGGANNNFAWTGTLTTGQAEDVTLPAIATTAGAHTLNASVLNPNGVTDENTANDASSSSYTAFTNGVTVDLEVKTDCWGSETDWAIIDGATTLYSGGPYTNVATVGETINLSYCLDPGCYDFEINDSWGDGMYGSQYGSCDVDGAYYITVAGRHVDSIEAVNADFANQEVNNFCIKSIYSDLSSDIQSVCENATATFTAAPLIGTATTYLWAFEGGTTGDLTVANPVVTYAAAGTYDVTLTVGDGNDTDTYTLTDYITVLDAPEVAQGTVVHVQCNGGDDGSINPVVSGGDGSYTYAWDNGAGTNVNTSSLEADDYTLTVTDGNMCEGSLMVTINEPAILVVDVTTNPASCGGSDGDATAAVSGGTGTYDYDWSTGGTAATETGLPGGAITVTVTDDNMCEMIGSGTVSTSNGPVVTLDSYEDVSCNGGSDGAINVSVTGGAGSNVFAWSNGGGSSEDASGLAPNTYTLTVTDANDCVSSLEQEIIEPTALSATIMTADAGCGLSDGTATVTPSGGTAGYTYDWSTGGTAITETGVPSGAISVIVTDSEMCTFNANGVVNSPNAPVVTLNSVTNVDCNGATTGAIDINVTGGSGGNTFVWTNGGGTNEDVTGVGAGEYSVTVTDMSSCTAVLTQEITENNTIEVTAVLTNENAGNDGEIDMTVSGGDGSYTFAWDNSLPATEDQTGLGAGTYSVTITDGLGCSKDTSFTLNNVGIDESTGIESAIYPNPTNGVLNIELKEINVSISIVNAFGQIVMNLRTTDNISVVNLAGFTKGMYMVQMTNEAGEKSTKKIVLLD